MSQKSLYKYAAWKEFKVENQICAPLISTNSLVICKLQLPPRKQMNYEAKIRDGYLMMQSTWEHKPCESEQMMHSANQETELKKLISLIALEIIWIMYTGCFREMAFSLSNALRIQQKGEKRTMEVRTQTERKCDAHVMHNEYGELTLELQYNKIDTIGAEVMKYDNWEEWLLAKTKSATHTIHKCKK